MLYIIRHGRTDWNVEYKLQGRTDIPLNDEGREMARKAAEQLSDVNIDICYSSPLKRAYETAQILLQSREVPIIIDSRLSEMCFGAYEGGERVIEDENCPIASLFTDPVNYKAVEGAESFEELFKRTGEFLEEKIYPDLEKGKDILIVGHGAMNCSIVSRVRGYDLAHFWDGMTDNCMPVRLIG